MGYRTKALFENLKQQGITVVLVTHEPDIAMRDGLLAGDGPPRQPATPAISASTTPNHARSRVSIARRPAFARTAKNI